MAGSHFKPQALPHSGLCMTIFDFLKMFQWRDVSFFNEKSSTPFAKCSMIASTLYLAYSGYIYSLA